MFEEVPRTPRAIIFVQAVIILAAAGCAIAGLRTVYLTETAASRLATVYALAHDGSWFIDRPLDEPPNPFERATIDKAEFQNRLLSTKPPVLPLLMTGEYLVLHHTFGWRLDNRADIRNVLRFMIATLVILPFVIGLVFFARIVNMLLPQPWMRTIPLFALAFGTELFGFAPQLNNHVPAAALLIVMLYHTLALCTGLRRPVWWRFVLVGLAGTLVFTLDMPATIFVASAGLFLLLRFPRASLTWAVLGGLGPLAVHFGVMLAVTHSPLPVQMHESWYLFESSYWRNPAGIDALNNPKHLYLFHMTFGRYGDFLLFPILITGLLGFAFALFRPGLRGRVYILAGGAAFLILTAYYVLKTNNYGGAAYGFRWYIAAMPVLLLMGLPVFEAARKGWRPAVLGLLLVVSVYSGWECYQQPWGSDVGWPSRLLFGPSYEHHGPE